MSRYEALKAIGQWADRERTKRKVIALRGILSAQEQRALKLKAAEKDGIAELIQAQKDEAEILADARASVFPVLTPVDAETRERTIGEYKAFRAQQGNRKQGAVIRWKLAKLRKDKAAMVKVQHEYEEVPSTLYRRRHKVLKSKVTVLRRKKDSVKYAALIYQIGRLEKQYESLYPPVRHEWNSQDGCYYLDSWIDKRPKDQTYSVPWEWKHRDDADAETAQARLRGIAERLKNARADIRALTPPADEETTQEQIAA